jgi:hypothetical protein
VSTAAEPRFHPPAQAQPVIRFSQSEIAWLLNEARKRLGAKRPRTNQDTYAGGKSLLETHFYTIKAEYAVVKAIPGAQLDTTVSPRGQPLGNVILPDGRRANAKWREVTSEGKTSARGGDYCLKNDQMTSFHGALGFLVWPELWACRVCAVQVMGFISRERFEAEAGLTRMGGGTLRLLVPHSTLQPITEVYGHDRIGHETAEQTALF